MIEKLKKYEAIVASGEIGAGTRNEMSNDNETVEQVCESVEYLCGTDGGGLEIFGENINPISLADRIKAACKREMADEKRISDAVIQSLRDKKLEMAGEIAEKEAEVSTLRALVGELADELSKFHAWEDARALVAKARKAIGGAK